MLRHDRSWQGALVLATSMLLVSPACDSSVSDGDTDTEPQPEPVNCDAPGSPASFEVGTGELCFERLTDAELPLFAGPQGGYHLFAAIGCADCEDEVTFSYLLLDPETDELFPGTYPDNQWVVPLLAFDGWKQAAGMQIGMPGFQWDDTDPAPPKGTPLRLRVSVTDGAGTREADLDFLLGDTLDWSPCDANPDGPCCGPDAYCN